jgi:hypothetical protein
MKLLSLPRQSGRLRVRRVPVGALSPAQVDRMWELYDEFYANVDRETFDKDLLRKNFVLLGTKHDSDEIVGFSTVLLFTKEHQGQRVGFYFSGDTIFHPDYWGQKGLHWATLKEWIWWKLKHPKTPLYWYLICSGHRTYLTLVRNFPTHWPHHQRATPTFESGLLDTIGSSLFGEAWHPDRGVISEGGEQPVLKRKFAPITPALLALPEIKFFFRKNPGHAQGDELAMLALVNSEAVGWMVKRWVSGAIKKKMPRPSRRSL